MLVTLTGALAGFFHVLSGPDHLAAVTPLAIADRERGWFAGGTWGLGHASGVVVIAVVAVLLRGLLPPVEVISAWGERIVGVALIAIGFWALRRSMHVAPGPHRHDDGTAHAHLHVQAGPAWARRLGHAHASFYMGILHGVAGSSHFFGVLPALALPTRGAALAYIAAFGIGTVVAMTAYAAVIGVVGSRSSQSARVQRVMMRAAALLAVVVGSWWLVG